MPINRPQLNIERLLTNYNVDFQSSPNNDWINTSCPFCTDKGKHLGHHKSGSVFFCWKCGKHKEYETVAALLNIPIHQAADVCKRYEAPTRTRSAPSDGVQRNVGGAVAVKLPYSTSAMTDRHRNYLRSRGFDPEQLEMDWGLLGTGSLGPFANRIIIPIFQAGEFVCYQGRDFTGKSPMRYKSCRDDLAKATIKNCVYGLDEVPGDTVVITEGAAKVWRLGKGSVATFGANVTDQQLLQLKPFHRRVIMFDGDETGRDKSRAVAYRLSIFPGQVDICDLPDGVGPDDLSESEAKDFMKEFQKG